MKQKNSLLVFLVLWTLLFSGCSLRGKPDGGVFKSSDGGNVFEQRSLIGEKATISNENILDIEIDKNNTDIVYIGTGAMGILRSTNGGDSWVKGLNNFTNVEDIAINPNDSNELYVATVIGGRGKIMKTTDGGTEWKEVFSERTEGARVLSLAIDKNNPKIIYAGDTLGGIYKTYDGADTWQTLLWAKSSVGKISIDSVNTSKVYFVTGSSGILRTDDAGANLIELKSSKKVYNVVVHPTKEGTVFISDDKGLQKSQDSGETLVQIDTLVKPEKIVSSGLAVNPKNDKEIYFSSGKAFYKTTNGGQTWKPVQFNTSRTIDIIKINPSDTNIIYLGTSKAASGTGLKLFPTR